MADLIKNLERAIDLAEEYCGAEFGEARDDLAALVAALEAARRCEAQPNRVPVYAAEWSDCVYESGYEVISLHASKAGAWRAGRRKAFARAVEDREASQLIGADLTRSSWRWRVRTYIVEK